MRARSGYVAPRDAPAASTAKPAALPPALSEILESPLAVQGLPLRVSTPAFRGTGSKASVAVIVEAGASQLQFTPNGTRFDGNMTLAIVAAGPDGKVQAGERGSLGMQLSSGTYDAILDRGARVVSRLELNPAAISCESPPSIRRKALSGSVLRSGRRIFPRSAGHERHRDRVPRPPIPTAGSDTRWKHRWACSPRRTGIFTSSSELRAR